jgi:procollagen-lysine,2-oxoglutarate 5-dioxygenase
MIQFSTLVLFTILQIVVADVDTNTVVDDTPVKYDLIVFTVATNETDGYRRLVRSAEQFGINLVTLGMGDVWRGGTMVAEGGGVKLAYLKDRLAPIKDTQNLIVMFVDGLVLLTTTTY